MEAKIARILTLKNLLNRLGNYNTLDSWLYLYEQPEFQAKRCRKQT
jgi:hypothetical protein